MSFLGIVLVSLIVIGVHDISVRLRRRRCSVCLRPYGIFTGNLCRRLDDVAAFEPGEHEGPTPIKPGATEPYMVMTRCGDLLAVWYCETHRCLLANVGQLEMHVDQGGTHRIAMWCGERHRVYEAARPLALQGTVAV